MASPRYHQFQHVGDYTVVRHVGHTVVNPRNGRIMSDVQHWYEVRCRCGKIETRSQQELRDIRRIRSCKTCRNRANQEAA